MKPRVDGIDLGVCLGGGGTAAEKEDKTLREEVGQLVWVSLWKDSRLIHFEGNDNLCHYAYDILYTTAENGS